VAEGIRRFLFVLATLDATFAWTEEALRAQMPSSQGAFGAGRGCAGGHRAHAGAVRSGRDGRAVGRAKSLNGGLNNADLIQTVVDPKQKESSLRVLKLKIGDVTMTLRTILLATPLSPQRLRHCPPWLTSTIVTRASQSYPALVMDAFTV